jgi:hypothetical protein
MTKSFAAHPDSPLCKASPLRPGWRRSFAVASRHYDFQVLIGFGFSSNLVEIDFASLSDMTIQNANNAKETLAVSAAPVGASQFAFNPNADEPMAPSAAPGHPKMMNAHGQIYTPDPTPSAAANSPATGLLAFNNLVVKT